VRMGVNMGPVFRHMNIKEQVDVLGGGIDMAQRVMDLGDGGHILVSHSVAEVLQQTEWRECLQDLGVHQDKNGKPVHVYNLCKDGLGNPETPRKVRVTVEMLSASATEPKVGAGSRRKWIFAGSIVAILAGGGFIIQRSGIVHFGAMPAKVAPADATKPSPVGTTAAVSLPVPDATTVYITLSDDVPADGSGSQTLNFTVRDDLKVRDNVVIAKGAKVLGSVVWGKRMLGLMGKRMNFRLMQAEAVDGQKVNIRATAKHAGKGSESRPFDTGKGLKPKDLAAAKDTEYIGYIDGDQSVSVRK